ncbi:unnamed protein product, partial [Discosporangium mesarthrocarpum]
LTDRGRRGDALQSREAPQVHEGPQSRGYADRPRDAPHHYSRDRYPDRERHGPGPNDSHHHQQHHDNQEPRHAGAHRCPSPGRPRSGSGPIRRGRGDEQDGHGRNPGPGGGGHPPREAYGHGSGGGGADGYRKPVHDMSPASQRVRDPEFAPRRVGGPELDNSWGKPLPPHGVAGGGGGGDRGEERPRGWSQGRVVLPRPRDWGS